MSDTIRSMTGFGSGVGEVNGFHITAEISSVNHRYLKVSSYLPDALNWAQRRVEESLRSHFVRGSVNLVLNLERACPVEVDIDSDLLQRLFRKVEAVRAKLAPDEEAVHLRDLLVIDGVVQVTESREVTADELLPTVEGVVDQAVTALREMQFREGAHLAQELETILDDMDVQLKEVERLLPQVNAENGERYHARIRDFLAEAGVHVEPSDLLREVAIQAEKADITEEIGRLKGHLAHFRGGLVEGGRIGRKLDFLSQEMFREANTMSAKANHYELSCRVVEIKAGIDRLREQTRNVE